MAKEAQKACAVLRRPETVWVNRLTSALMALSRCRAALGQAGAAIRLNRRAHRHRLGYAPVDDYGFWAVDAQLAEHLTRLGHIEAAIAAADSALHRFEESPAFDRDAARDLAGLSAALRLALVESGDRDPAEKDHARTIAEKFGLPFSSIEEGAADVLRCARDPDSSPPYP